MFYTLPENIRGAIIINNQNLEKKTMKQAFLMLALTLFAVTAAAKVQPITVRFLPASVVKTVPQAGSLEVDPKLSEIKVTFSKDMLTKGMWSWCQVSKDSFPETVGKTHYLEDKRTCVLPVKLKRGKTYAIWINTSRFNNFRDTDKKSAIPYLLVFKTKD